MFGAQTSPELNPVEHLCDHLRENLSTWLISCLSECLAAYIATKKEAIRGNRANVAERLGFLGRVVHGSNPRVWLRTLKARLGEAADSPQVASEGE
jgi:hypothetical protein